MRASGGEPEAAVRIGAEQIRQRIAGGEDFATVAAAESADAVSATRGGDLGWFPRGRMVAPFEEAAFALADGELSPIVRTGFGFHLRIIPCIRTVLSLVEPIAALTVGSWCTSPAVPLPARRPVRTVIPRDVTPITR